MGDLHEKAPCGASSLTEAKRPKGLEDLATIVSESDDIAGVHIATRFGAPASEEEHFTLSDLIFWMAAIWLIVIGQPVGGGHGEIACDVPSGGWSSDDLGLRAHGARPDEIIEGEDPDRIFGRHRQHVSRLYVIAHTER